MKIFKTSLFALISLSLVLSISSCKDEDEDEKAFPEADRGEVEADSYWLILEDIKTSELDTFGFGSKSMSNLNYDTIEWKVNTNTLRKYKVRIQYFNNGNNVTQAIRDRGTSYINCYRDFSQSDLRLEERGDDSNSSDLGLYSEWAVENNSSSDGLGSIKITLNYQSLEKNGLCDPGFRIFEAVVPYKVLK